ncbi:hypothetical protein [Novosphingobium guangzhouense]|uniref:Uncharacterized protein n=1 Tax=Novosphingobium guangzhouense TaxID=1850347 RepID=A0A2K2G0M0_9SPHN|nr:hypothetical protein [Novosphingobium guangzhouense]PNU04595.1 hypothetical protein A8V01_19495 [Novosphingobium guangzhouense]
MSRSKLIEAFIEARTAFLTYNKYDLETYIAEKKEAAAAKALADLSEQYDLTQISDREIYEVTGRAAASAVAHINLNDLSPSFFLEEPYFTLRNPTKTRKEVVEAAQAFMAYSA